MRSHIFGKLLPISALLAVAVCVDLHAQTRPLNAMERQAQRQQGLQLSSGPAGSQVLRLDKLEKEMIPSPKYNVARYKAPSSKTKEWHQSSIKYKTAPDWVDELTFRYFILLKNTTPERGANPFTLLKGEVKYINIEKGDHESRVYIHPSTISRFGDVEHAAVLVFSKGQKLGMESTYNKPDWWEELSPTPGLILNRLQTPFSVLGDDSFEAISE